MIARSQAQAPGDPVVAPPAGLPDTSDYHSLLVDAGGGTWEPVLGIPEGAGPIAWQPSDAAIAYVVGFDRRLYRSADGGASWEPIA